MKKYIALLLAVTILLTGCSQNASISRKTVPEANQSMENTEEVSQAEGISESVDSSIEEKVDYEYKNIVPEFGGMDDARLLRYVEDNVYTELINELDSEDYFVENVSAMYLSEEYLEELEYNSKKNIYFGYTLDELDETFQGTRYVFTLGDNNETVVQPFEAYDDTYQRVIKNVAIGSGVILICVTVSVATAGAGAPAISMIFAAGAKTGSTMALSSASFGGIASAIITGVETKDINQALKSGLLAGSESFKWGAITGVIAGGATEGVKYAKAMEALKGVTLNGITTQEAAAIQMQTGFPIDIIKQFHSMEEFNVYKDAGLVGQMVNGELALVQKIDLAFESELPDGRMVTNLQRMAEGYAPIEPATGKAYQLHHVGQKADASLAILTEKVHQEKSSILHVIKESEIDRKAFDKVRKEFWKAYAQAFM